MKDVIRRATDGTDVDEFARFLQARLAVFLRIMALLFGLLYFGGMVLIGVFAPAYWVAVHTHPSKMLNLSLTLIFAAGVWFVPRRPRPMWLLRAIDLGGSVLISTSIGFAVTTTPVGFLAEVAALLFLVITMILRSAIVPSTARFTVLVGACCAPPIIFGAYVQTGNYEIRGFLTPGLMAAGVLMWCVAITAASATVSREIYGLVAQVQKAMRLGRYTLGEKIGEGGMGAVYRADHAMLRRPTAIKLLLPDRVSASALVRFEREVQLTSRLSHPNTIAIHDYGRTPHGVFYYAMEYLEGRSLERLVTEEGPQPASRVIHIMAQVAGSLREAHEAGLIHRDVKPGNLLIGTHGGLPDFVKVIDFGLVKQLDPDLALAPTLTQTDAIAGTPLFMAPECITRPESIDAKVDTYAFGATMYFLLTGMPVFDGRSMVEICGHHMHTQPTPPSARLSTPVPPRLEALVLRCLEKDPARRPNDSELLRILHECAHESLGSTLPQPWFDTEHAIS